MATLFAATARAAGPSPALCAATPGTMPAPNPRLVGGWLAKTEVEGKQRGHWIELRADGAWRRIEDYFGFRAENSGRWLPDGDGAVLENIGVRLRPLGGKLLLDSRGETLYAFEPCPTMPAALGDLPPFPRTLSQTVAILSAELAEPERIVIAATLEEDLPRFHHGLGTHIRNHFGLWGPNPALLTACKVEHPDDASQVILRALRRHLRDTRPGGRELDQLERVVGSLNVAPIPVRQMTVVQFLTAANREVERALVRQGLPRDAVALELAPAKNVNEQRGARTWLSHPPRLRAWGRGEKTPDRVGLVALLPAFKRWLKVPGRVMLEPDFDPRWYRTPEESPDFSSARWRNDWFEIETSTEEGAGRSDSVRVDAWAMIGDVPPMPVEQAAVFAGERRERFPAGKHLVEIAITGSPVDDTWEWAYAVRSRVAAPKGDDATASGDKSLTSGTAGIRSPDLISKSKWPDPRKPPRVSAAQALALVRSSRPGVIPIPAASRRVEILLRRVGGSAHWYYQIALRDHDGDACGVVTLDGRVLATPDCGGAALPEPPRP